MTKSYRDYSQDEGLMIQTTLVGLNFHRTTEKNRVLLPVLQGRGRSGFNSRAGTKPNRASLERMIPKLSASPVIVSLTAADLTRRIETTTFATTSQLHRRAGRRSSPLVECSSPNPRPLLPSGASLRRCP